MPWHSRRIALSTCGPGLPCIPHRPAFHNPRRRVLGYPKRSSEANVPLSPTGAELLFGVFSQRYERGSILVTTNLTFDEWTEGLRLGKANWRAAGPAHPPCPLPGDGRRKLPPQAQQGNRRLASSRRSRGRIRRTVNAVSTRSFNVPTPTNLMPSVITSVVHDHAAPVAQYLGAIDITASPTRDTKAPRLTSG